MSRFRTALAIGLLTTLGVGSTMGARQPQRGPEPVRQLAWVDRQGTVGETIGQPQDVISGVALSPDGTRVAVRGRADGNDDIYVHTVASGEMLRLTDDPAHARHPEWSPDATRIAFFSYRNGPADIFSVAADGSGQEQPLFTGPHHEYYPSWSRDGRYIAIHLHNPDTDARGIWYLDLQGNREPAPVIQAPFNTACPRLSPDGRYVAYQANEDGRWQVHVSTFPAGTETWKVSTDGGVWPKWGRESGELFYFEDDTLIAVSVSTGATFTHGTPQSLFSADQVGMDPSSRSLFNPLYDVAPEGQRFVVVRNLAPAQP